MGWEKQHKVAHWTLLSMCGELEEAFSCWLWPGPAMTIAARRGVDQQVEDLYCCLSILLYNFYSQVNNNEKNNVKVTDD